MICDMSTSDTALHGMIMVNEQYSLMSDIMWYWYTDDKWNRCDEWYCDMLRVMKWWWMNEIFVFMSYISGYCAIFKILGDILDTGWYFWILCDIWDTGWCFGILGDILGYCMIFEILSDILGYWVIFEILNDIVGYWVIFGYWAIFDILSDIWTLSDILGYWMIFWDTERYLGILSNIVVLSVMPHVHAGLPGFQKAEPS